MSDDLELVQTEIITSMMMHAVIEAASLRLTVMAEDYINARASREDLEAAIKRMREVLASGYEPKPH